MDRGESASTTSWPFMNTSIKDNKDKLHVLSSDWYVKEQDHSLAIDPPMIVFDNGGIETSLTVASSRKPGTLLRLVHQLSVRIGLVLTKVRISSDEEFVLDTFSMTDQNGLKITDEETLRKIQAYAYFLWNVVPPKSFNECENTEQAGTLFPGWSADIIADLASVRASPPDDFLQHVGLNPKKERNNESSTISATPSSSTLLSSSPSCNSSSQSFSTSPCSVISSDVIPYSCDDLYFCSPVTSRKCCIQNITPIEESSGICCIETASHSTEMQELECERIQTSNPEISCVKYPSTPYLTVQVNCEDHHRLLFDILYALEEAKLDLYHSAIDTDLEQGVCDMEFQISMRQTRGMLASPWKGSPMLGGVCEMSEQGWDW
eukprot:CAMPEP_0196581868 /NCGR_PEP_ID=MMETSP1081-20130531/36110_1 /TAXON_ID=36882 /ORGANISM="Pyramimonas amylifera, Strain CCMP720" /LENGTH=376 /DNA_ID=CAMNT_0041902257 /DNA_START=135 /DNA_END=1262 /DNA_ORIENTATION=+